LSIHVAEQTYWTLRRMTPFNCYGDPEAKGRFVCPITNQGFDELITVYT